MVRPTTSTCRMLGASIIIFIFLYVFLCFRWLFHCNFCHFCICLFSSKKKCFYKKRSCVFLMEAQPCFRDSHKLSFHQKHEKHIFTSIKSTHYASRNSTVCASTRSNNTCFPDKRKNTSPTKKVKTTTVISSYGLFLPFYVLFWSLFFGIYFGFFYFLVLCILPDFLSKLINIGSSFKDLDGRIQKVKAVWYLDARFKR